MNALIASAHVGLGEIDARGTITALNGEFARLFRISSADLLHKSVTELPSPVTECWSQIVLSADERPGLHRWHLHVGEPPDRRSLEVVGWASTPADGDTTVHLLVSEAPPEHEPDSLSGVAERARLAREIHDGLAQDLWLAKLTASKLARLPTLDSEARALCDDLLRSIDSGLTEARTAVMSMRSPEGVITLSELVERQVEEFSDRFGIRVDCFAQEGRLVPSRVSIEILRILQEALNNVRKHADARRIVVRVRYPRDSLVLSVGDDGIGFDQTTVEGGYGRQSMHERAQSIGARLDIASVPGRGTTVTLRVPANQLVTHR